jgi:hypothetical protein
MTMINQMKSMASSSKRKLQPGKAYKVRRPAKMSSAASKMKNMAASCQACAGK